MKWGWKDLTGLVVVGGRTRRFDLLRLLGGLEWETNERERGEDE